MREDTATVSGTRLRIYSLNTAVVGSGAAGLNAADRLHSFGQTDVAVVTEGMNRGTSRNTGSDKQTYYKLTLAGGEGDSVREMAETLFRGGAVHGDIALVEAALSARCFYRLVEIGVPFPHTRHGEYCGYKTDHDPRRRATSAGPLTSRFMTERLQAEIERRGIRVFDGFRVIAILTDGAAGKAVGLLALDLNRLGDPGGRYVLFNCTNVVYAVGGPAGMYGASVYPESQTGASGIAFEAGAPGCNLTESQFGIASVKFRWNLSGAYQQVLPRYVSTDADGGGEREFLADFFPSPGRMLDAVFLKGYQWPFDPAKALHGGSSLVDLLVFNETVEKGRRVFLDYRANPASASVNGALDVSLLGGEARRYLEKSGALFGTPVDRLERMNRPALELFRDHGIDLRSERLEIAVCAQHSNGGLAGNIWWESPLRHFFPVGEANGSHGVHRPGGGALNAGQVGGTRAAQFIARRYADDPPGAASFIDNCRDKIAGTCALGERFASSVGPESTVMSIRRRLQDRMDACGAVVRERAAAHDAAGEALLDLERLADETRLASIDELPGAFLNRDLLIAQQVYLAAIADYIGRGGKSRGSYIVRDPGGDSPHDRLPETFRFSLAEGMLSDMVQVARWRNGVCEFDWEPVRPVPDDDDWFETVWNEFLEDGNVR